MAGRSKAIRQCDENVSWIIRLRNKNIWKYSGDWFSKYLMSKTQNHIHCKKNARKLTHFRKALSLGYERSNQCKTSVQNILDLIGDIPQNYTRCGILNYNSFSKSFHSFNAEVMLFLSHFWLETRNVIYYRTKFSTRNLFTVYRQLGTQIFNGTKKLQKVPVGKLLVRGSASWGSTRLGTSSKNLTLGWTIFS